MSDQIAGHQTGYWASAQFLHRCRYMPEGPSIILVRENVKQFAGKKIISAEGNTRIDLTRLVNRKVLRFKSWGKHFLICFSGFTIRIHFLLFGSYLVNERKDRPVRLRLSFDNGEINFYASAIKILDGDLNLYYDWSADVMSKGWDPKAAMAKIRKIAAPQMICDTLLDQQIFSGVGNIIKNEVLYRLQIHPESLVQKIPAGKLRKLIDETRVYSFDFLKWKRDYVLKKHWLAHTKKTCVRCKHAILKKITGKSRRRSFFCVDCQKKYG